MSELAKLSSFAEITMGQSPSAGDVNSAGVGLPLLNGPTEFTDRHPVPVQFTSAGRKICEKDDLLFCVRGSTTGRMNYADQRYAIGRGLASIRGKNGYPTPYVRAIIEHKLNDLLIAATGSTFPNVGKDLLAGFLVPKLPLDAARAINKVLTNIEDKIYTNRRMNETLEGMAQAVFKSWFVDFDPVHAKAEALKNGGSEEDARIAAMCAISGKSADALAQLKSENPDDYAQLAHTADAFPSAFVDSDLGQIPEGWEVKTVNDIINRLSVNKRYTKKQVEQYGKVPVYEQGASILLGYHDNDPALKASPQEPKFIFGDHTCVTHLSCHDFDISQNVIPVEGKTRPTMWVYYAIQGKQVFQEYRRHWSEFIIKDICIAPEEICRKYADFVTNFYIKKEQAILENQSLAETRDALLPKLLSGEIDVTTIGQ